MAGRRQIGVAERRCGMCGAAARTESIAAAQAELRRCPRAAPGPRQAAGAPREAWSAAGLGLIAGRLGLLMLFAVLWPAAAAALTLGEREAYPLAEHLVYLEDPSGALDLAAASAPETAARYRPAPASGELNFGYSASAYWLRLELTRTPGASREWLLDIAFPSLDDVELYLPDGRGGHVRHVAGDRRTAERTGPRERTLVFPVTLAGEASDTLWLRLASQGSLTLPATLWAPAAFHAHEKREQATLALYFGMLLALALYNLMLWASLREAVFLRYVGSVLGMAVGQAAFFGVGQAFLWQSWPLLGHFALPVGMAGAGAFGAQFARGFLDTARRAPRLDRLLQAFALLFAAGAGLALLSYRSGAILISLTGVAFSAVATASGIHALRRGQRSARYFLLAWTLLLAGVAVLGLRNLGWLPTTWITVHALQIGSGLEMLLLALALADRLNGAREDKDRAQAALVRAEQATVEALRRSEQMLEANVAERTAALDRANARYRNVVDNVTEVIFQTDAEGRWTFLNRAWAEVTGHGVAESLGQPFLDFVHPDDRERNVALFAPLIRREKDHCRHEVRYLHRDGGFRWIQVFARLTLNDAGGIAGTSGTLTDVTEARLLEESLRRRERYQGALLDNFPFAVWLKDGQSRFLAVNAPFLRACGKFSREAVAGLTDFDVWPQDRAERHRAADQSVLRRGLPIVAEEPVDREGERRWFETYTAPVALDGAIIGTVGFARDITEKKRIEAELERHRHHLEDLVVQRTAELAASEANIRLILESTGDGLYGIDEDGLATFINPAACRMLGYTPQQALGRPMHALIHHTHADGTPFPAEQCPIYETLRSGRDYRCDRDVFWHADGHPLQVMYLVRPILREGRVNGAVVSFVDIAGLVAANEARERARQEAERLARVRHEFLANMSHEIRTPLNGVLGMAQIGLRGSAGRAEATEAFGRILDSGRLLLGIIDDILDFSKIEAGELHVEALPCDLHRLLEQAVDLLAERARAKGVALHLQRSADLPRYCLGDALRIEQILVNLLSNAIKFTPAGEVTLTARREGARLVLSVDDSGIGMTAEQLARVFQPFQQADGSITRRYGGTGLGLTISTRLAALMNGEIRARSQPGQGSCFELRLPLIEAASATPPRAAGSGTTDPAPLAGMTLLVAEDTEVNRVVLEGLLESKGARIALAHDGAQAVEEVARNAARYALVLMDIQMPGMDGYEATGRIRAIDPALPVIGQTAHAMPEERAKCLAAGMVDHVAKPIDIDVLVAAVLRHARGAGGEERPAAAAAARSPRESVASRVDWRALEARFGGNPGLIERLARAVHNGHGGTRARLAEAIASQDMEGLAAISHAVKGIGGNLMLAELHRMAAAAETAARQRRPDAPALAQALLQPMQDLLDQASAFLSDRREQDAALAAARQD